MSKAFLTAEWRNLAMLNYRVDPALLQPFAPTGTELDTWNGHTFMSLVGFEFSNTRVLGLPIPFHRDFEEVNLRFYVRRTVNDEVRRAVIFIREMVPRFAIALVARLVYNEPYVALPMRHRYGAELDGGLRSAEYGWRTLGEWGGLRIETHGAGSVAAPGSEEEFITEHYWGYTRQRDGSTIEYRVTHPPWRVWSASTATVTGDLAPLYGAEFARVLSKEPTSAFLADGSAVTVYRPTRLTPAT